MNFQLLKENNDIVEEAFVSFCLKSKPYDFCSGPSMSLRTLQIKSYYQFLMAEKDVYFVEQNRFIRFFIAIQETEEGFYVDFIFGLPFKLGSDFKNFRQFYRSKRSRNCKFFTKIKRKHKLQLFLKGIKKRDASANFCVDNGEICVSWIT